MQGIGGKNGPGWSEEDPVTPIRIQRRIDSDTLHLEELRPFIGRELEITLSEPSPREPDRLRLPESQLVDGNTDPAWQAALSLVRGIEYDEEAYWEARRREKA